MATVALHLRISPADNGRTMTLDDYLDAEVEEGYRYELARGVLEVSNIPDDPHGVIVCNLYDALSAYRRAHSETIYRYGGGGEFQLLLPAMISGRHPDVAVTLRGTPKDSRGRRPASFAIEVVSEGKEARYRDYATKRQEYLAYGLREYWIVDPELKCVTLLIRDGDTWVERIATGDQSATSVVLPGFVVALADLWPADDIEEDGNTLDPGSHL